MIINEVHTKYSGVLAPTNYTENRNYKVKELQFVKQHLSRCNNNSINKVDGVAEEKPKSLGDKVKVENGADEILE